MGVGSATSDVCRVQARSGQESCVMSKSYSGITLDRRYTLCTASSEISKRLTAQPSKQVRADLNLNTGVRYQGLLG